MIFIWGMAVLALAVFITTVFICHIDGDCGCTPELFGKENDNNGYCRDLQHEIAAERKHNA
ncbi:hypothetical protein [Kingella kingae]|uniref:hypothetical protein n=1 Tax=Kingella kingae TaxID=504 RepID=UPI000409251A|nr:hypothetical protein [Kingella kingae]